MFGIPPSAPGILHRCDCRSIQYTCKDWLEHAAENPIFLHGTPASGDHCTRKPRPISNQTIDGHYMLLDLQVRLISAVIALVRITTVNDRSCLTTYIAEFIAEYTSTPICAAAIS